jgi:hypothetical protein
MTFESHPAKYVLRAVYMKRMTLLTTPQHGISLPIGMIRLNLERTMHYFKGAVIYCPLKN